MNRQAPDRRLSLLDDPHDDEQIWSPAKFPYGQNCNQTPTCGAEGNMVTARMRALERAAMGKEMRMRVEHLLLMASIAVACPALSADPKATSENTAKADRDAQQKARSAPGQMASEDLPNRSNRKPRVHRTFPPPARHL